MRWQAPRIVGGHEEKRATRYPADGKLIGIACNDLCSFITKVENVANEPHFIDLLRSFESFLRIKKDAQGFDRITLGRSGID